MQIFVAGTFIPRKNPIGKNLSVIKVFVVYFSIFLLKLHLPLKFLVQKCFNFAQNLLKIKSNFFRVMHETFKFMVVRHPFERLLSAYRYCLPRGRHKCRLLFNQKISQRQAGGHWPGPGGSGRILLHHLRETYRGGVQEGEICILFPVHVDLGGFL